MVPWSLYILVDQQMDNLETRIVFIRIKRDKLVGLLWMQERMHGVV